MDQFCPLFLDSRRLSFFKLKFFPGGRLYGRVTSFPPIWDLVCRSALGQRAALWREDSSLLRVFHCLPLFGTIPVSRFSVVLVGLSFFPRGGTLRLRRRPVLCLGGVGCLSFCFSFPVVAEVAFCVCWLFFFPLRVSAEPVILMDNIGYPFTAALLSPLRNMLFSFRARAVMVVNLVCYPFFLPWALLACL